MAIHHPSQCCAISYATETTLSQWPLQPCSFFLLSVDMGTADELSGACPVRHSPPFTGLFHFGGVSIEKVDILVFPLGLISSCSVALPPQCSFHKQSQVPPQLAGTLWSLFSLHLPSSSFHLEASILWRALPLLKQSPKRNLLENNPCRTFVPLYPSLEARITKPAICLNAGREEGARKQEKTLKSIH